MEVKGRQQQHPNFWKAAGMNQPLCIVPKQMQMEGDCLVYSTVGGRGAGVRETKGLNKQAKVSIGNILS